MNHTYIQAHQRITSCIYSTNNRDCMWRQNTKEFDARVSIIME